MKKIFWSGFMHMPYGQRCPVFRKISSSIVHRTQWMNRIDYLQHLPPKKYFIYAKYSCSSSHFQVPSQEGLARNPNQSIIVNA